MELCSQLCPFPHLLAAHVLSEESEATALSKLNSLRWKDLTQGYYRFWISVDDQELERISDLPFMREFISNVRLATSKFLRRRLSSQARLTAHRYDEMAVIGFHTDHSKKRQARFVLNLNAGWSFSNGGIWVLSNRPDVSDAVFLPPLSNTGFAFETNVDSFHALTRRLGGLSYALVVEFDSA